MTLRGLHLPTRRVTLGTALVMFVLVTVTNVGWAMKMGLAAHARGIGVSILGSLVCLLVVAGLSDLQHRLHAAGWSFEAPLLSRWLAYYVPWGVFGFGLGLGRIALIQVRTGMPLSSERAAFVILICVYMTLFLVWALENQAMFRATIARKQESSRRAVSFLFRTREAFVRARDLRRLEALDLLERQVEPELAAIHEGLTHLRSEGRPELAVAPLVKRLDRLRIGEIREVSHLLHPSIIDMGLAPALRALVRSRSDDRAVTLEIEEASVADLPPAACLQLYRIVELALDGAGPGPEAHGAETQGAETRVSVARPPGAGLRLEVAMRGGEPSSESGFRALLDARVALLGGAWSLERDGEGLWVLRVSQPPLL